MFYGADAFNQDISSWDVGSGTDFSYMFAGADAFEQYISNWQVSDTARLTNMFDLADLMTSNRGFSSTPTSADFNKTPITDRNSLDAAITAWIADEAAATATYGDINTWDVRAITDFSGLFNSITTFNSDISLSLIHI